MVGRAGAPQVADVDEIHVACCVDGQRLHGYRVKLDPEIGGMLLERAEQFYRDHIIQRLPVPMDGTEGTGSILEQAHPEDDGTETERTDKGDEAARAILELGRQIQDLEKERDKFRHVLQGEIGDARKMRGEGWSATWSNTRGRVSTKSLIAELAELAGLTTAELRRLENRHRANDYRQLTVRRARS